MLKIQFIPLSIIILLNLKFRLAMDSPELVNANDCMILLEDYANSVANFTKCFIEHARPITVCKGCINDYKKVCENHQKIINMPAKSGPACHLVLVNVDRLEVIEASFKYVIDQWNQASCAKCFKKSNDTELNSDTVEVRQLYSNLLACEERNSIEHIESKNTSSAICTSCQDDYLKLNNFYDEHGAHNRFCMDIVDMINSTRGNWSDYYKCCDDRQTPQLPFLILASAVCSLPVIFYTVVWLWSKTTFLEFSHQHRWTQKFHRLSTS